MDVLDLVQTCSQSHGVLNLVRQCCNLKDLVDQMLHSLKSGRTVLAAKCATCHAMFFQTSMFHSCSRFRMLACMLLNHYRAGGDLKEDGLSVHSPEVCDGVTAVTAARQQLQRGITAWTKLF